MQREWNIWVRRARNCYILLVCMRAQPVGRLYLLDTEDISHIEAVEYKIGIPEVL